MEKKRNNSGNSAATGISALQIIVNNEAFDDLIERCAPKELWETAGKSFWIQMGTSGREEKTIQKAKKESGK